MLSPHLAMLLVASQADPQLRLYLLAAVALLQMLPRSLEKNAPPLRLLHHPLLVALVAMVAPAEQAPWVSVATLVIWLWRQLQSFHHFLRRLHPRHHLRLCRPMTLRLRHLRKEALAADPSLEALEARWQEDHCQLAEHGSPLHRAAPTKVAAFVLATP